MDPEKKLRQTLEAKKICEDVKKYCEENGLPYEVDFKRLLDPNDLYPFCD